MPTPITQDAPEAPAPAEVVAPTPSGPDVGQVVAGAIKDALGPVVERVGQLQEIVNRVTQPPPPPKATLPPTNPLDDLAARPREFVRETAAELFNERAGTNIAPWMESTTEAVLEHTFDAERTRLDKQYGPGFFDEHILPAAKQTVAALPYQNKLRPASVRAAVQLAMSERIDDLVERKTKIAAEAKEAPPELMRGGSGRRQATDELSPDERQVIAEVHGLVSPETQALLSPKLYALARDTKSVKDWRAKVAAARGGKAKAN